MHRLSLVVVRGLLIVVSSLVAEYRLSKKAMAPHSSTLTWKIPWTEEPGRLQSTGSLRVRHDWATFTFHFHALEKEMATHSSALAWRIPGTGEPGGLLSMGSHRVRHDWSDLAAAAQALGSWASVVAAQELSCSTACRLFLDQRPRNPCPLPWQVDSKPLNHQWRP